MMSELKIFQDNGGQGSLGQTEMTTSVETDLYLKSVVQATPRAMMKPDSQLYEFLRTNLASVFL